MKEQVCISIVMGSQSDYETLKFAEDICISFSVPYEIQVVSAHRTPELMFDYAKAAKQRGVQIIIAGAGGAAHLPGMLSALTTVPVLGVPVASKNLKGLDSLLSIVQMPGGIPTATFAIGQAGASNAALFAIQILALHNIDLQIKLDDYRKNKAAQAIDGNTLVQENWKKHKKSIDKERG